MKPEFGERMIARTALLLLAFSTDALADDESPERVQVVQRRQYEIRHELEVSAGFLPLDSFYKGLTANVGYTYHFNDHFGWRVGRFSYSKNISTGLQNQIKNDLGLETTPFPEVQVMAGSDLVWSPFYGKFAFMNVSVVHVELFLVAGAGAVLTQLGLNPEANLGGGIRFFLTQSLSLRVEGTNHFAFGKRLYNVLDIQAGLAVNFGG